jgi:hypothetical protein
MKLEARVVKCTSGSRGKVPGERKPVIRDDDDKTNSNKGEVVPVLN